MDNKSAVIKVIKHINLWMNTIETRNDKDDLFVWDGVHVWDNAFPEGKYSCTFDYEKGKIYRNGIFDFIMTMVLPNITEDDIEEVYKVTTDYAPCDNICIKICSKALTEHWNKWRNYVRTDNDDDAAIDRQRQKEIDSLWKIGCFHGTIQIRKYDIGVFTDDYKHYGRNVKLVRSRKIQFSDELCNALIKQINDF